MRKFLRFSARAAIPLAAITVVTFAASPAFALNVTVFTNAANGQFDDGAGGFGFVSDGDKFTLCDNRADGAGVRGYIRDNTTELPSKYFGGGNGECSVWSNDRVEGHTVSLRVCLQDDGVVIQNSCSAWGHGTALKAAESPRR